MRPSVAIESDGAQAFGAGDSFALAAGPEVSSACVLVATSSKVSDVPGV
jgi:hypothetical protein